MGILVPMNKLGKKCRICGGELQKKTITHAQEYEGKIIILENVPAEVCRRCGEVLLRPEVLEKVQALVWSKAAPKRRQSVPVYDLAEVG